MSERVEGKLRKGNPSPQLWQPEHSLFRLQIPHEPSIGPSGPRISQQARIRHTAVSLHRIVTLSTQRRETLGPQKGRHAGLESALKASPVAWKQSGREFALSVSFEHDQCRNPDLTFPEAFFCALIFLLAVLIVTQEHSNDCSASPDPATESRSRWPGSIHPQNKLRCNLC